MAMRLLRAALLSLILVSLGSCSVFQFLLGSVFPSTVTLLKAQQNLSVPISSQDAFGVDLRVIETGGTTYVVLSGTTTAEGNIMMFFDADLNLKTKIPFTLSQDLGVFVDGNGKVIAGNEILSADLSTRTPFTTGTVIGAAPGVGADGFLAGNVPPVDVMINNNGASVQLPYQTIADPVSASLSASAATTVPLSASSSNSNLQVDAVLDDGNPTGSVYIVVGTSDNNNGATGTSYFLTISKTAFASGGVAANLVDTAPHRDGLEPGSFGYVDGKIAAYDTASASYVLMDPATTATVSSFYSHIDPKDVQFGYSASGGSFYTFDRDSRILSKYSKWW